MISMDDQTPAEPAKVAPEVVKQPDTDDVGRLSRASVPEPSSSQLPRSLSVFGVTLEDAIKVAGAGVAVCYAVGLVVVQLYLISIGVADFSLVQTRYVLTGFFTLLPLLAVVTIGVSVVTICANSAARSHDIVHSHGELILATYHERATDRPG
jgi:hypothetical protein